MNKEHKRILEEAEWVVEFWKKIKSSSLRLRNMSKKHCPSEIQKYEYNPNDLKDWKFLPLNK